jgi:hypothetical protein
MSPQELLGPVCQSCGMPLNQPEDFGTAADGHRMNDYCRFCYRDGVFMNPDVTLEQMIDQCVGIMARQGIMPEAKARALLTEVMPGLKRWREAAGPRVFQTAGRRGLSAGDEEC